MPPKTISNLFTEQKKPTKLVFDAESRRKFVTEGKQRKDERRAIAMELRKTKERRQANSKRRARRRAIMMQWEALYSRVGVHNPLFGPKLLQDEEQQQQEAVDDHPGNLDAIRAPHNFGFELDDDEDEDDDDDYNGNYNYGQLAPQKKVIEYEPRHTADDLHKGDDELGPKKIKLPTNSKGVTVTIEPFDLNMDRQQVESSSSEGERDDDDEEESHNTPAAQHQREDSVTQVPHLKKIWGIQLLQNLTQGELKKKVKAYHEARKKERKVQKVKNSKSRMRRLKSFRKLKKKKGKDK